MKLASRAARERDEAIELLADLVSASASLETGIVSVRTQTDWPRLSFAITTMVTDLISRYNLETMQTRASEERRFVDERLAAQRVELTTDEDSLRQFLEENRQFASAPQLVMEHDRLQRKVALRQQVVVGLAQAYEQSRIEEVRNTPVLTTVQLPEVPAKGIRRFLALKLAAVLLLTLSVMIALAIVQEEAAPTADEGSSAPLELSRLLRETTADFQRLIPSKLRRHPERSS